MSDPARFPFLRSAAGSGHSVFMPLLLGQVNFFHEFDANFLAARRLFELRPAAKP